MEQRYSDVVVRYLNDNERRVKTNESQTPLVIEPKKSRDCTFLQNFLNAHSTEIIEDIEKHGAVLLRGFDVHSAIDFEKQILSIRGMSGIKDVFLSESGRINVGNAQYALHTNTLYKTGGTLGRVGGFHTENYYVPDVPRFISFFCIKPSWLGGETGLINVTRLYENFSDTLKKKLEKRALWVSVIPLNVIMNRYGITSDEAETFCIKAGLPVETLNYSKCMILYKPSIIEHPVNHDRAVVINISAELEKFGLPDAIHKAFLADYLGIRWILHRIIWQYRLDKIVTELPSKLQFIFARKMHPMPSQPHIGSRVGEIFDKEEIELMAQSMRRYYSSFLWKRGDVLILDNLKIAHAGMPGFGPRELNALICNPVAMSYSKNASGLLSSLTNEKRESLGEQLRVFLKK